MKKVYVLLLFGFTTLVNAQNQSLVQKEIDQTVWKPFTQAFETLDGVALNALYADEVLRVTPRGIDTENNFKTANLKRFEENKTTGTKIQLRFWFDSRHTNASTSYEVGFYKMQLTNFKGSNTIYGQFHIVLKKIDGRWKITQDWDTTMINGIQITAADFEKQKPIVFD